MAKKKKKYKNKNGNKHEIRNIADFMPISDFFLTRYTKSAWNKCYPSDKDYEAYKRIQHPYSVLEAIGNMHARLGDDNLEKDFRVSFTILDDSYFDWLKKYGYENTSETRTKYATQHDISDEENERRLAENDLNVDVSVMFIPVAVINTKKTEPTTHFAISFETCCELKKYLEKIYTKEEVYVPGYVMNVYDAYELIETLETIPFDRKYSPEFFSQKHEKGTNLNLYAIPFVLVRRFPVKGLVFREIMDDVSFTYDLYLDEETLSEFGHENVPSFENEPVFKTLTDDLKNSNAADDVVVFPEAVYLDDSPEFMDEIVDELESVFREAGKSFRTV